MNARERVRRALEHKDTDRVPVDIGGTPFTSMHMDAYRRIKAQIAPDAPEEYMMLFTRTAYIPQRIRDALGSDCYPIFPPVDLNRAGVRRGEQGEFYVDEWGCMWRRPEGGLYFDLVEHPLKNVEEMEDLPKNLQTPGDLSDSDWAYLTKLAKEIHQNRDLFVILNCPQNGSILSRCAKLMGYETYLMNIAANPQLVAHVARIVKENLRRYIMKALQLFGDSVDGIVVSDDLGTQEGPMMQPTIYRKWFKPIWAELIAEIRRTAPHIKIIMHSCGSICEFLDDLIDLGVDAVNPVQVSAKGMGDTEKLKQMAKGQLSFWGGACDSQRTLEFASPEEVRQEVRRRKNDLGQGGGLVIGSIQTVQVSVPEENVWALYRAMKE